MNLDLRIKFAVLSCTELELDLVKAIIRDVIEEVIGEDSHIHDGAAGDEATWEAAQNTLRAIERARAKELGL